MIALADLRLHLETDLPDAQLQLVLSAVDEELKSKYGVADTAVEEFRPERSTLLFPDRMVGALTSVKEYDSEGVETALDVSILSTADVRLINKRMLERLATGSNPSNLWAYRVVVEYAPDDVNRRDLAVVQLVKLELEFKGLLKSEDSGDYSSSLENYDVAKARIVGSLRQVGFA